MNGSVSSMITPSIGRVIPPESGNGLSGKLSRGLQLESASVDVAVCNTPYLAYPHTDRTDQLLRSTGLKECIKLKKLSADILFSAGDPWMIVFPYGDRVMMGSCRMNWRLPATNSFAEWTTAFMHGVPDNQHHEARRSESWEPKLGVVT